MYNSWAFLIVPGHTRPAFTVSCCRDKILNMKQLKGRSIHCGFWFYGTQSLMVEKAWCCWQEAFGGVVSTIRKLRDEHGVQFAFLVLSSPGPQAMGWFYPQL